MSKTHFCLRCGKSIPIFDKQCKYCGKNQFGENNEHYPDDDMVQQVAEMLGKATAPSERPQKEKDQGLTVEEQFFLGIHPDDEMYRKTLELEILSKKY